MVRGRMFDWQAKRANRSFCMSASLHPPGQRARTSDLHDTMLLPGVAGEPFCHTIVRYGHSN
jgi:hypothetical protein